MARNFALSSRRDVGATISPALTSRAGAARESRSLHPLPSRSLTFSEPLEPMKIGDAPLNVRVMLRNLLLMLVLSACFIGGVFILSVFNLL
jgi:hypothetical protein